MFKLGTIYIINCKDESVSDCYIGSTQNLLLRKYQHSWKTTTNSKYKLYEFMRDNGGYNNFEFTILEENIKFIEKKELLIKEQEYINFYKPSLNKFRSYKTPEQKAEYIRIYRKKYRAEHQEYYKNYMKYYNAKNKFKFN